MTTETNSPAFMLYRVDGNGPDARRPQSGAARPHRHGPGCHILRAAVPLPGRIVMREYTPKPKDAAPEAAPAAKPAARKAGGR